MTGIVYKSTGSWYSIKAQDGTFYDCRIKGKFRIQGIKSTNPLAVGDVVDFDLETSNNKFDVSVLQGTTGSGKTLVYFDRIKKIIDKKKQALVLLPEIFLTNEFKSRFEDFFVY